MIYDLDITKILFLDIETVPQEANFSKLDKTKKHLWEKKAKTLVSSDVEAADVYSRAGIYAEFGKIVCISIGFITIDNNKRKLRLKSFFDDDEKELLSDFNQLLNFIKSVNPKIVYTVFGFTSQLAKHVRKKLNIKARPLQI